jgi:hypothetical protein
MKKNFIGLFLSCLLLFTLILVSCGGQESTTNPTTSSPPSSTAQSTVTEESLSPEPGVLLPSQINSSQLNQVVKVKGRVVQVIQNPGGQGGLYLKISGGSSEVGIRIEQEKLNALSDAEKAQFEQGKVITVEGMLVLSGTDLVVVLGAGLSTSVTPQPSTGNATFIVKVPENTVLSYAVSMELFNEQNKLLGFVKMEQQDSITWRVSIPSGSDKIGYRYTRDGVGFPTAEEFKPDSDKTLHWVNPLPGTVINDVVTKWRWCPMPGYIMPIIASAAKTTSITKRINNEEFQCGYQFIDFWWGPFHDLVRGTNLGIKNGNGNWIKIAAPVGVAQIEPVFKLNWDVVSDNPIYPPGELEYQISQAQNDGLNVLLTPQWGSLEVDCGKQYSDEWWDSFYTEMERFSTYFATLAEKCGVKYLALTGMGMWNNINAPSNIKDKFAEYIANTRQHYSGKLGMVIQLSGSFHSPANTWPLGYFPEKFDFLAIGGPGRLSDSKEPTVDEMKANFKQILESAVAPLYEKYQKPIILYSVGYPSLDGAASGAFTHDDPPMDVYAPYSDKYQLDLEEQAEIFEALLQVVAETPYIIGFYPFNSYWPSPLPLSKLYNVWDKPAGQIIAGWYQRFIDELK